MKCTSCGEKIKGKPVWVDDDPYCSEECAGTISEEDEEFEKEEEDEDK